MSKHDYRHPLSRALPSRPHGPMRVPARVLAWFGIGLGLAELAMPRRMARIAGAPGVPGLIRAHGLREIGTGIGILASKDPAPWLWGRVLGDVLDAATVGAGLVTRRRPVRTLTSVALLLGVAWLDFKVAESASLDKKRGRRAVRDYSDRSGFPRPAAAMRGIALKPSTKLVPGAETRSGEAVSGHPLATAVAGSAG